MIDFCLRQGQGGANILDVDRHGVTALHQAAWGGSALAMRHVLRLAPGLVPVNDDLGFDVTAWAVFGGSQEAVEYAVEIGGRSPLTPNPMGSSALDQISSHPTAEMCEMRHWLTSRFSINTAT